MQQNAGPQISTKFFIRSVFLQSVLVLFALMLAAGALTFLIPTGSYQRQELDGRIGIDPASFQYTPRPDYPFWRWFTAPLEVLWGPDGLTVIVIIVFLLLVGASFAVLEKCGLLQAVVARLVGAYGGRKYTLLLVISLFFMAIGAFFGIFEEVVPLVPLTLALSYYLGWDALVGLGMSILAVNMGFSAAITNPFTIGVAQKLAGLPLFSGAWLRLIIFAFIYVLFAFFLTRYARRVEAQPETSPVFEQDRLSRERYAHFKLDALGQGRHLNQAILLFLFFLVLILLVLLSTPFLPAVADYSLPLVGLLFFIGGISAALLGGASGREVSAAAWQGLVGIAPAILLILMAASVKYIVVRGGILDTIIYTASQPFSRLGPYLAALLIYLLVLVIEFFVASGSAKAFLLMPILLPLADLVSLTRQTVVTSYCFGDGFSNLAYPTNPVLLICLGLASVGYFKWLRWSLRLWFWVLLVTVLSLLFAVAIGYGPF